MRLAPIVVIMSEHAPSYVVIFLLSLSHSLYRVCIYAGGAEPQLHQLLPEPGQCPRQTDGRPRDWGLGGMYV